MAIILVLLLSYISGFATQVEGQPLIVAPLPDNVYAIENSTAQVSCTVIDRNGTKPDRIEFIRKSKYGDTKIIYDEGPKGRVYYENKTEDGGKRLQVTLHINRVLLSDSNFGGHECHGIVGAQRSAYGFTMNVIHLDELPRMEASCNKTVEFGETVVLNFNYTIKYPKSNPLVQISWLKDGELIDAFICNMNLKRKQTRLITITSPHQGGLYSCRFTFKLRGVKVYNITKDIAVTVKPKFFANDLKRNEVKVIKGKSTKMVCSAKGNPLKTVWSMNNVGLDRVKPINISANATKYIFSNLAKLENHTLTVTKTALSDAGRYFCCIGNDSRPEDSIVGCQVFILIVKDLPDNWLSVKFENLLLQAEALLSVDYIPPSTASGLLHALENATKTQRLNGGDLDVSVKVLSLLTNKDINVTSSIDRQNVLGICSNILEPINVNSWIQFEDHKEMGEKALWDRVVVTLDKYGLQLAKQIPADSSLLIETASIVMKVDRVNQQNKAKKTGLTFEYAKFQSSLYLPSELFCGDIDYHVVNVVYKTLNNVMRLQGINKCPHLANQVRKDDFLASNATIFSSMVDPPSFRRLDQKVKITMKNNKVIEPALQQTCVFWKEGFPSTWFTDGCSLVLSESSKHVTTCECDHLTVFASLMDPYGRPMKANHRKALELISTIGCAISLFAVLLTILVTMFFWKTLKSPRTIVLVNICVAIGVVCILVIAEGAARQSKVGCTVMAVLLHYFLLAVFCWMLCEGVLLYFLLVKVIGAGVEEKIKFFVLFGWGFPMLIVGISLGATQTNGYGYHGDQTVCWLSVDNGLIWAFVGPAIVVLLINIIIFVFVIRQMMSTRHAQSKSRDEKLRMGVKATAVILPLLGITWLFGLLAFNSSTLAFKYIFAIFNSLQGLVIFIFHCLLNQQIRGAIQRYRLRSTNSTSDQRHFPGRRKRQRNSVMAEEVTPVTIETTTKYGKISGVKEPGMFQSNANKNGAQIETHF